MLPVLDHRYDVDDVHDGLVQSRVVEIGEDSETQIVPLSQPVVLHWPNRNILQHAAIWKPVIKDGNNRDDDD